MRKKLLLTGATGFIGQSCLNVLENLEFEIHALYHNQAANRCSSNVSWHHCDILNFQQTASILEKIQPDYLIHTAWFVEHKVFWTSEKNIDYIAATINLYKEFSLHGGKKCVVIGSCAEYDQTCTDCDENNTPLIPNVLYGIAKKQTFELLTQLKKDNPHYASFSWVRLFNIFGPHENPNRLIPYIFSCYFQGFPPNLNYPSAIRDHLYVDNLAEILIALFQTNIEGAINIGQGIEISIAKLTEIIQTRYFNNLPLPRYVDNSLDYPNRFIPILNKLHKLKLKNNISFDEGLERTFKWWASRVKDQTIGLTLETTL